MKKNLVLFFLTFISLIGTSQSTEKDGVRLIDRQFDESYANNNLGAMFKNVAEDCVFYGTDPSEKWTVKEFRALLEDGIKKGMPAMKVTSKEEIPLSDGNTFLIVKKINWVVFKTELRQIVLYENQNGTWKMKMLSLNLNLPNHKTAAFNKLLE